MKHTTRHLIGSLTLCALTTIALRAAPLASNTPVYASPDTNAATLATLAAGTEPTPSTSATTVALPAGWQAIDVTTSTEVWVRDSDLNKELDVKPGATLRTAPQDDAKVVGTMAAGDVTELSGIQGKWVKLYITKKATGYISTTATAAVPATSETQPVFVETPAPANPPVGATIAAPEAPYQPVSSLPYATYEKPVRGPQPLLSDSVRQGGSNQQGTQIQNAQPGRPASNAQSTTATRQSPTTLATTTTTQTTTSGQASQTQTSGGTTVTAQAGDGGAASLARTFQGTFASTRRAFAPRRPYDFQLTDASGNRIAYLDMSNILVTEQFDNYVGRTVIIYGTLGAVPSTSDIVVRAQTMQLK